MWKLASGLVFLCAAAVLALPASHTNHDAVHDALLELEKDVTMEEVGVAQVRDFERGGEVEGEVAQPSGQDKGGAAASSSIPQVEVPANAFVDKDGNLRAKAPEVFVRTQHAHCPDAQCPKAKMENIGLAAKGYNILFGNPFSTTPGIDPGFVKRGGGAIWEFEYKQSLETADGRFERPDHTQVEHNVGCSLSMSNAVTHSEEEDSEESSTKVSVDAEVEGAFASGAFSADARWNPPRSPPPRPRRSPLRWSPAARTLRSPRARPLTRFSSHPRPLDPLPRPLAVGTRCRSSGRRRRSRRSPPPPSASSTTCASRTTPRGRSSPTTSSSESRRWSRR